MLHFDGCHRLIWLLLLPTHGQSQVATARKLPGAIWHVLTKQVDDCSTNPVHVARKL